jgi:iron complex outermembrane receptor protein
MIRNRPVLSFLIAQLITAPLLANLPAYAEDAPTPAATEASSSSDQGEKIEVTGSHIKRIDSEGPSPVTTITKKDIERTGYNSVADVLRQDTGSSFGAAREQSGSNAAGNAEVNLRGLGSTNTLVLLNGQRMPTDAVTGAVDLNMIPLAAVERIEILKDGASAIYGSDALGGVVNIITRKDFNGNELDVRQSLPQHKGGARTDIGLVNGISGEKFNAVTTFAFRNNWGVNSRDRDWTSTVFSPTGAPGSYRDAGTTTWHADPNCPANLIIHTPSGDRCQFNTADYSTELPDLRQFSLMTDASYEMSSNLKLFGRIGLVDRHVNWSYAPAPDTVTVNGAVVPALPGHVGGTDVNLAYRFMELGNRTSAVDTYGGNILLGSTLQLGKGWALDTTATHNRIYTEDKGISGYAIESTVIDDINNGTYKPFNSTNHGTLENARYVPKETTTSYINQAEAKVSGEIAQLPNGPAAMAAGVQVLYQNYKDVFDDQSVAGNVLGNAGSSGGGDRTSESVYTEFGIPTFKDLEFQLAGRYDHYSDFGNTFNPKIAAIYHVTKDFLLRSSFGTGFKAPLLQDLHAASSDGYETFIDHDACKTAIAGGAAANSYDCLPHQYHVQSGGNTGLKQETSVSWTLGTVYQVTKTLSFGADWFLTKTKNVVGIDYDDLTLAEANGVDPTKYGVNTHRDSSGHLDDSNPINAPLQNLSSQQIAGLDLNAGYSVGRFHVESNHSLLFYYREEGFPGSGQRDKLGQKFGDLTSYPKWRNTSVLSYQIKDHHSLSLTSTTIAGTQKAVPSEGNLSSYTQFDLQYAWAITKTTEFTAGILNLLGTTPPLDDSANKQLNTNLYDQIGRQFLASYRVRF